MNPVVLSRKKNSSQNNSVFYTISQDYVFKEFYKIHVNMGLGNTCSTIPVVVLQAAVSTLRCRQKLPATIANKLVFPSPTVFLPVHRVFVGAPVGV